MKKQKMTQWLLDWMGENGYIPNVDIDLIGAIEQANKIFELQILDAYNHGYWESEDPTKTADMYYNETFGKRHNDVIQ